MPANSLIRQPGIEYYLNTYLNTTKALGLLPKGFPLASEQFSLSSFSSAPPGLPNGLKPINIKKKNLQLCVEGTDFTLVFDRVSGFLTSFRYQGNELIQRGFQPNFRRALTDNDIGCRLFQKAKPWFEANETCTLTGITTLPVSPEQMEVIVNYHLPAVSSSEIIRYLIRSDGEITVTASFIPGKDDLPELPRFGLNFSIPDTYRQVTWFGRGPWENYQDRNTASFVGLYSSKADDLYTPYIRPQENGYHTDVRVGEYHFLVLKTGYKAGVQ